MQRSSGIVGMASIVNLATLNHEEETLLMTLIVEMVNGSSSNLCERKVTLTGINGIGKRILHSSMLLYEQNLISLSRLCLILVVAANNGISSFTDKVIKLRSCMVVRIDILGQIASSKEVEARGRQLGTYFIVVVTTSLMCIERSRSGMIDGHTSCDTYLGAIAMGHLGYAGHGSSLIGSHTDDPIVGFMPSSQCSTSGCRIGYIRTGRV